MLVTERQSQQLRRIQHRLRRLNRAALARLRRMRFSPSDKQCRDVGQWLGIAATHMTSMLLFREQIIEAVVERKWVRIMYVDFVCSCPKDSQIAVPNQQQPEEEQPGLPEALECAPVWQEEIDQVVELARCIEQRALERGLSRGILSQTFFSGLHRFVKALLQQKRQLLEPIPESSNYELKLVQRRTVCKNCDPAIETA